ncbi:MAG: carbamoyl phosphate synthase small subunit [Hydrogenoanaerobacterium sp.]
MQEEKKAWLILQDGTEYEGQSIGASGTTTGELVFTTGAVGCQEAITSPSFCGQIIVQTFPLAGNYGVNDEVNEAASATAAGYVVRECCDAPSNFRSKGTLSEFLKSQNIIGIQGIDTRALTIHLRENSNINGCITTIKHESLKITDLAVIAAHRQVKPIEKVSCHAAEAVEGNNGKYDVTLYDLGCDKSVISCLQSAGCNITKLPYNTPLVKALESKPDGIVFAGGPESFNEYEAVAENIKSVLSAKIPLLGLGSGHHVMALAAGGKVSRLAQPHRGANQAVHDDVLQKTFVTSQNHALAVDEDSLSSDIATVFCRNVNDKSCEGIVYKTAPAFSIQFSPECFTATANTHYYIDKFVAMMNEGVK